MNILERIASEMSTDDDDMDDQSERLIAVYEAADEATREVLDEAFICVCGWRLKTLIHWDRGDKGAAKTHIRCDMNLDCEAKVKYIDDKGFVYCMHHAAQRKLTHPVRLLRPSKGKK